MADKVGAGRAGKKPADAVQLLNDGAVVVTGLWPYAHPAPAVDRAIASAPELCGFRRDFARDLARLFHAIAVNLVAAHGER